MTERIGNNRGVGKVIRRPKDTEHDASQENGNKNPRNTPTPQPKATLESLQELAARFNNNRH